MSAPSAAFKDRVEDCLSQAMQVAALACLLAVGTAASPPSWIKASATLNGKMVDSDGMTSCGSSGSTSISAGPRCLNCGAALGPAAAVVVTDNANLFVDPGRVRIFHGVNAVNKGFPWYWTDFLANPQHMDDLQAWG